MNLWKITDADAARDLRCDTEADAREEIKDAVPEAPDFTKMRGPSNKYARRLDGRNN